MFSARRESVRLAGEQQIAARNAAAAQRLDIISVWFGGTTLSSSP